MDFWACARALASALRAQAGCARTGSRVAGCQHIVQVCVSPNPNWFMSFLLFSRFFNTREGGEIGLLIKLVSKVLKWRFIIRWLNNFRDFYSPFIGWFIKLNVQTLEPRIVICRRGIFCVIIEGIHQFIGHCLIPLYPRVTSNIKCRKIYCETSLSLLKYGLPGYMWKTTDKVWYLSINPFTYIYLSFFPIYLFIYLYIYINLFTVFEYFFPICMSILLFIYIPSIYLSVCLSI